MSIYIFVYLLIIVVLSVVLIIINKRNKAKSTHLKLEEERQKYLSYKSELENGDFKILKKWMKNVPIDAFTTASFPRTNSEQIQQLAKQGIQNIALSTIGVRYREIETPAYLVLSGKELHFLHTDIEGDLKQHLIFGPNRLELAKIKYTGLKKTALSISSKESEKHQPHIFLLSFNINGEKIEIEVHDRLTMTIGFTGFLRENYYQKMLKNRVVGEQLILKLSEKYSNLKIDQILN